MQIKIYGEQWLSTAACGFEPDDDKWEILRKKTHSFVNVTRIRNECSERRENI